MLLLLITAGAQADSALPMPSDREMRSPNGRCVAHAEVAAAQVRVSGRSPDGRAVSWRIPGWHRAFFVADDCLTLAVGYHGANRLDLDDRDPGTPVMTFWRSEGPTRVVRLGEVYAELGSLPRTESHFSWWRQESWDGRAWTVETVDGRRLTFAP